MLTVLIDYESGNLHSAHKAFERMAREADAGEVLVSDKAEDVARADHWEIIGAKLSTQFSNNIRNNFGFLNHTAPEDDGYHGDRGRKGLTDKLFVQNGRSVFKEVVSQP